MTKPFATRYILKHLLLSCLCAVVLLPLQGRAATGIPAYDVVVVGGGASGTTAGIQAARMGVKTLVIEEGPWLGGMLTAAGVTAIDGNNNLAGGLWGELRNKLRAYYGGAKAVETGWVSNTLFEPHVAAGIFKQLAINPNLAIWYHTGFTGLQRSGTGWRVEVRRGGKAASVMAKVVIDATELGDVLKAAGAKYRIGMDSGTQTGEAQAPAAANDIIQDLTYVATLKDYGPGADKTIAKPAGYNDKEFEGSCNVADPAGDVKVANDCAQMISYGKLPNNKYMINWPKHGNDMYLNIIEKTPAQREAALKEAKLHTLRFVYYLQSRLGYKNLGLADDEYPTSDKLPMMAYHRESRRVDGLVQFNVNDVAAPYAKAERPLYRTGIAVGDYPIDHHHLKRPDAPKIDFVRIKVPAYTIPLGALVPRGVENLIVAEKSISVTNIVNGTTRLQPVVLEIGQAAGALAAVCIKEHCTPAQVNVRNVQASLLAAHAYLQPFMDITPADADFSAIQRIGATGILKGTGIPYRWANQTRFYPNLPVSEYELLQGLKEVYPALAGEQGSGDMATRGWLLGIINKCGVKPARVPVALAQAPAKELTRREAAVVIDAALDPFGKPVDFNGLYK